MISEESLKYKTNYKPNTYFTKDHALTIFSLLIIAWYCFFSLAMTQYGEIALFAAAGFPALGVIAGLTKNKLRPIDVAWIIFLLLYFLQVVYSPAQESGIRFAIAKILVVLIFAYFSNFYGWEKTFFKIFFVVSIIHAIAILIDYIAPDVINSINRLIMQNDLYAGTLRLRAGNYVGGLATQVSFAATYVGFAVIFCIARLFTVKKNAINLLFLFVSMFALLLTAKRGAVLAAFIAALVGMIVAFSKLNRKTKKSKWALFFGVCLILAAIYFIYKTGVIDQLFNRENFFSRRDIMWEKLFEGISASNILLGHGTGAVNNVLSLSAHNIYIQMIYENGIVGLVLFITILSIVLKKTISLLYSKDLSGDSVLYLVASLLYQIFFIVYGLTDSVFYNNVMFVPYALMAALPFALEIKQKKEKIKG